MRDPATLRAIGEALFGASWQTDLARLLEIGHDHRVGSATIRKMLSGVRPIRAGMMVDLCHAMRERAAELSALADAVEPDALDAAGGLHGLTPRDLDAIGHVTSHEVVQHGPAWLAGYAHPSETLRQRVTVEIADGGVTMPALSARRVLATLSRLTDAQAVEVAQAVADVADLTEGIPD